MTKDEARRILKGTIGANSAKLDGELGFNGLVTWRSDWPTAELEGNFTAEQLEAIAIYMRDNYDGGEP